MGHQRSTVITLDLQLYEKAQKLMSRSDMKGKFVLRMGELHTVFAALHALGKYVEASGIDQAWVESGMYSPTTVRQILDGKHIYRAMEAHMVTTLTLYNIMLESLFEQYPVEKDYIQCGAMALTTEFAKWSESSCLKEKHSDLMKTLAGCNLLKKIQEYDTSSQGTARFVRNYAKQFECILRYIRASRQGLWRLHLSSQEELNKYFLSHDLQHYGRLSPVYCAEMQDLETNDPDTWKALENGDLCVNKNEIPFCSIGPDHGIEHENRSMKVLGGIVGITQSQKALDRFFWIAPEMSRLTKEFEEQYSTTTSSSRKWHHDLTGSMSSRVFKHVQQLTDVIMSHGNPFTNTDEVVNLVTKAVMPDDIKADIVTRDEKGQKLLDKFVGVSE